MNKKRGNFTLELLGHQLDLKANFDNISRFEEGCDMGIYTLGRKMSEGDIRISHIINMLFYFNTVKNQFTKDQLLEYINIEGPETVIIRLSSFIKILFGVTDDEVTEDTTEKK